MSKDFLKLGDWNAICDVCGFKFKASRMQKRWDGLMVCEQDYELRNPQDYLRVPKETVATAWSRPEPTDTFVTFRILTQADELITTEDGIYLDYK